MKEDITEGTKNDIEWQECVIYPVRVFFYRFYVCSITRVNWKPVGPRT